VVITVLGAASATPTDRRSSKRGTGQRQNDRTIECHPNTANNTSRPSRRYRRWPIRKATKTGPAAAISGQQFTYTRHAVPKAEPADAQGRDSSPTTSGGDDIVSETRPAGRVPFARPKHAGAAAARHTSSAPQPSPCGRTAPTQRGSTSTPATRRLDPQQHGGISRGHTANPNSGTYLVHGQARRSIPRADVGGHRRGRRRRKRGRKITYPDGSNAGTRRCPERVLTELCRGDEVRIGQHGRGLRHHPFAAALGHAVGGAANHRQLVAMVNPQPAPLRSDQHGERLQQHHDPNAATNTPRSTRRIATAADAARTKGRARPRRRGPTQVTYSWTLDQRGPIRAHRA